MFMTPTRQEQPAVREPPPLLRMNLHQWQQQQQQESQQQLEQLELSPLGLPLATHMEEMAEELQQQSQPSTPSPLSDFTVARLESVGQLAGSRELCVNMAQLLLAGVHVHEHYFSPPAAVRGRADASAQASTPTSTLSSPDEPEMTPDFHRTDGSCVRRRVGP